MLEPPLDEFARLPLDLVDGELGRLGRRRLAGPRLAVLRVEAVLSADGRVAVHQDAGPPSHASIEGVHPPGRLVVLAGPEVVVRCKPTLVRHDLERALHDEGLQVDPQLPLGRLHHPDRPHILDQRSKRLPVRNVRHDVPDGDAAGGLLEGEVPQVAQDQGELPLVVRAARGLPRALDHDDPQVVRILSRERADLVGQLVIRDEDPAPVRRVDRTVPKRPGECAHRRSPWATRVTKALPRRHRRSPPGPTSASGAPSGSYACPIESSPRSPRASHGIHRPRRPRRRG